MRGIFVRKRCHSSSSSVRPSAHPSIYCAVRVVLNARVPPHILSLCCPSPSTTDRCMRGCLSPCSSFMHARATVTSPLQTPTTLSSTTLARLPIGLCWVCSERSSVRVRRSETGLCMIDDDVRVTNRRRKFEKQKPLTVSILLVVVCNCASSPCQPVRLTVACRK